MDTSNMISLILAVLIVVEGIYCVVTGKMIGNTQRYEEKYTPESLKKYYRISGIFFILIGAFVAVVLALNVFSLPKGTLRIIALGALAVFAVLFLLVGKTARVEKNPGKGKAVNYIDED